MKSFHVFICVLKAIWWLIWYVVLTLVEIKKSIDEPFFDDLIPFLSHRFINHKSEQTPRSYGQSASTRQTCALRGSTVTYQVDSLRSPNRMLVFPAKGMEHTLMSQNIITTHRLSE